MARKLAASVYVNDADDVPVLYKAGTSPPADVAKQISNEAAWEPASADDDAEPEPPPKKATPRKKAASGKATVSKAGADAAAAGGTAGDSPTPPAADATLEVHQAFAEAVGVPVEKNATVESLREALGERGLLDSDEK